MKLMIATPMYGGMCSAYYHYGIIDLIRQSPSRGLEVTVQFTTSESLITRARNNLVRRFLESDSTHMIFIDADIGFQASDVFKLLDHDVDVVCGPCPAKVIDWEHVAEAARNGVPAELLTSLASPHVYNWSNGYVRDSNGLLEVPAAGTGVMLIRRSVFEKLIPHVPSYTTNMVGDWGNVTHEFFSTSIQDDTLMSEDYNFCVMWRRIGGRVFVDTTLQLKHIGNFVYESSPNYWASRGSK